MRFTLRAAAAVGTLLAVSNSFLVDAFIAAFSFHAAVSHTNSDRLRFSSSGRPTAPPSTTWRQTSYRRPRVTTGRCATELQGNFPSKWTRPAAGAASRVDNAASAFNRRSLRSTTLAVAPPLRMSADDDDDKGFNPLNREDPDRVRVNNLITILAETPMNEWKPAVLDEHMPSLLKRGIYRQTIAERFVNVRSGDDREALDRVDAYLTGYLAQESRRASRKKVSSILSAATEGPTKLDECVQALGKEDLLDSDLTEYVASLVTAEENRGIQSELLKVLKMVRDRIQAELRTGSRPEIRTLARALQINNARERKEFLKHAFTKLEELDEFVKFVQEGIEYMGDDFGFAVRTNMPQENFDKMKAVYADAAALRRVYLQ